EKALGHGRQPVRRVEAADELATDVLVVDAEQEEIGVLGHPSDAHTIASNRFTQSFSCVRSQERSRMSREPTRSRVLAPFFRTSSTTSATSHATRSTQTGIISDVSSRESSIWPQYAWRKALARRRSGTRVPRRTYVNAFCTSTIRGASTMLSKSI